jgi:hypothetical protein
VTPAFIRRILKLSFLAPAVLEKILNARVSPAVWHKDMATITDQPWFEQEAAVFSQQ